MYLKLNWDLVTLGAVSAAIERAKIEEVDDDSVREYTI